MPPRAPVLDYESFYQYHNRLASYLDWPLKWEIDKSKPTPEVFARAGFFYNAEPPHQPDNVICPFCRIFLDEWEAHDDPMSEHKQRSPFCPFVRGRIPGPVVNRQATVQPTQAQLGSNEKSTGHEKLPSHQKPQHDQEPQHDHQPHGDHPR